MSVCTWDRVGTVQKGEVLDLESVYDAAQPVPDAEIGRASCRERVYSNV